MDYVLHVLYRDLFFTGVSHLVHLWSLDPLLAQRATCCFTVLSRDICCWKEQISAKTLFLIWTHISFISSELQANTCKIVLSLWQVSAKYESNFKILWYQPSSEFSICQLHLVDSQYLSIHFNCYNSIWILHYLSIMNLYHMCHRLIYFKISISILL